MTTTSVAAHGGLLIDPALLHLAWMLHATGWRRLGPRRHTHRAVRAWYRGAGQVLAVRVHPAGDVDIHLTTPAGKLQLGHLTNIRYAVELVTAALRLTPPQATVRGGSYRVEARPRASGRWQLVRPAPTAATAHAAADALCLVLPRTPLRVLGPDGTPLPRPHTLEDPHP